MGFNFRFKFKYIFIWALGGYFVFHPLAMIIGAFMSGHHELFIRTVPETVMSETVASFTLRMMPWSLLFAVLNGVAGWFHATLKLREKEIRRSFQAQTVLNKLLKISLDITPLEAVLTRIIDELISLPWFALESKGAIFVVEDGAAVLEMKAQRGLSAPIQKDCAHVPFGRCLCGRAAQSGKLVFATCIDDRHEIEYHGMTPHGHYCIPMIISGKVIGVITLYVKEGHHPTAREEEFLRVVADVVAGILQRKQSEKALLESEKRYRELSITDGLTRLYNSRHYFERLGSEIERSVRYGSFLSLILLDIDDFKHYNDTYGHPEGDKVLAMLGKVIRESLRKTDSAYRYGGEEFTVILPETKEESAVTVAERIRSGFESLIFSPPPGEEVHKTISIGVAQYLPKEDLSSFMNRADEAMYNAKEQGKNRVIFSKLEPGNGVGC